MLLLVQHMKKNIFYLAQYTVMAGEIRLSYIIRIVATSLVEQLWLNRG